VTMRRVECIVTTYANMEVGVLYYPCATSSTAFTGIASLCTTNNGSINSIGDQDEDGDGYKNDVVHHDVGRDDDKADVASL
jgi:hypothetical protein